MSAPVSFLARYDALDAALVAAGFPATSPWWRKQIERFFGSARRRWVIRAGRRAGKSSTLCRLAVAVALWGAWSVPPGDIAVIPFVSVDRDEASARLRTIGSILRSLGVRFSERAEEIELHDRRVVFRVVSATVRGTVGFTSVALFCDEMARWESRDNAANPAREVAASLRPTMATQPTAFEACSSSPWGTDDYHAEIFDLGDDYHQITSYAPTWEANPTISEAQTRELESDPRIWSREYAAIPGAVVTAALDAEDLASCFGRKPAGNLTKHGFFAIDASSLRGDAFAWLAGVESDTREIVVDRVGGWEGEELRRVSLAEIVRDISTRAKKLGVRRVFGDQREEAGLRSLFAENGIKFLSFAWTDQSKDDAVQFLRRGMRESKISIVKHEQLRRQLGAMKARLLPSGRIAYATGGLDYASALITLAHAAMAGEMFRHVDREVLNAANARLHGRGAEPPIREHFSNRFGAGSGRGFG